MEQRPVLTAESVLRRLLAAHDRMERRHQLEHRLGRRNDLCDYCPVRYLLEDSDVQAVVAALGGWDVWREGEE